MVRGLDSSAAKPSSSYRKPLAPQREDAQQHRPSPAAIVKKTPLLPGKRRYDTQQQQSSSATPTAKKTPPKTAARCDGAPSTSSTKTHASSRGTGYVFITATCRQRSSLAHGIYPNLGGQSSQRCSRAWACVDLCNSPCLCSFQSAHRWRICPMLPQMASKRAPPCKEQNA